MVSIPSSLSTEKTAGSVINQSHINDLQTGVINLGTEFNTAVTSKLTLFTPVVGNAVAPLRLPSSSTVPSSVSAGDIWNQDNSLRFRDASTSRIIVLSGVASPISATTLNTSGNTDIGGTLSVTGNSTFNGAVNINQPTAITVSNANAFSVKAGATNFFTVNTADSVVNVAGSLQINSVSLLSPEKINTGGFTFNIGNGEDVLTSGAQLPIVALPYACEIVAWAIYFADGTARTLTLNLEKSTPTTSAIGTFSSIVPLSITSATAVVTSLSPVVSLAQGDLLRLNITSTSIQATRAAIHIRVRKI